MALSKTGCVFLCFLIFGLVPHQTSAALDPPILLHTPLFNYGTDHGDTQITDYGGTTIINLPVNISYFGSSYKQLFISPDGIVGFEKAVNYIKGITWSEGVRNPSTDLPFLAPFLYSGFRPFKIEESRYQGKIYYRVMDADKISQNVDRYSSEHQHTLQYLGKYMSEAVVNTPDTFKAKLVTIVTWHDVAADSETQTESCTVDDRCKSATFQAVLVSDEVRTFAIFNYRKMEIPFKLSFQSGFNGGHGRGWYNVVPCHGECVVSLNVSRVNDLPNLKGSDLLGRYILDVGDEVIVRGGCLPNELRAGMLEVFPREVGMFGGEMLQVSGRCLQATSKIYCRFGASKDSVVTTGAMINGMKGYCPVPLLTRIGQTFVSWSADGSEWVADRVISVVLPSVIEPTFNLDPTVRAQWMTRQAKSITVTWDPKLLSQQTMARVEVRLIGYREDEANKKVEYVTLENLGEADNSQGRYDFDVESHRCKSDCEKFELGLLEVGVPSDYHGVHNGRAAVRYGPIPLGWYVNQELEERRGKDWSDQKCKEWHEKDSKEEKWMKSLLACPCSLSQALADFGRWQADPGCNLFTGSACHYHKDAIHCVRSVVPTPEGAGNQCCFSREGTLLYSQLSYQGSTPDRGHVWGSAPYDQPDRVPSLSHWKHDVVSFYYCCLWNDYSLCDLYMEQRPTADCKNYDVPGIAFLRGSQHMTTFDNQLYQSIGSGDFWLVKAPGIEIQGRFTPSENSWDLGALSGSTSWKPTALTAIALQGEGQVIEIHPAPKTAIFPRGVDIRVGNDRKFFTRRETMWQYYAGQTVMNNAPLDQINRHDNFTILMNNNVGINVFGANGLLHVTVSLPPDMKPKEGSTVKGLGLMGAYDENPDNDFMSKSGAVSSPGTDKLKLFENFGMSWQVDVQESLFPFHKKAEAPSTGHVYPNMRDIPKNFEGAPQPGMVSSMCGDNLNCQWDYYITGDRRVAQATRDADVTYSYIKSSAFRVDSCGLPEVGTMAKFNAYNFSVGEEVKVIGCGKDRSFSGEVTYNCMKERLDKAKEQNRADYGIIIKDPKDKVDYIIHWQPKPKTVCSESSEGASTGIIVGVVIAVIVVIIVVALIAFFVFKKRKSGKSNTEERGRSPNKREAPKDPGATEAMLSQKEDRSPVYKPSKEPVRMSHLQGSSV